MTTANALDHVEIAAKIARLVEERGWNQEDFARIASMNRHTARTILQSQGRKLRNATVQSCARALGLTVSELRTLPLERLLPRMRGQSAPEGNDRFQALLDQVTQPELAAWLKRNEDRARRLTPIEADELINMQGPSGPLVAMGVERVIEHLERKRELLHKVQAVAGTEYLSLLEQIVTLLYDKTRPNSAY